MLNLLRYLIDNFFGAWTDSEYFARVVGFFLIFFSIALFGFNLLSMWAGHLTGPRQSDVEAILRLARRDHRILVPRQASGLDNHGLIHRTTSTCRLFQIPRSAFSRGLVRAGTLGHGPWVLAGAVGGRHPDLRREVDG